MTKHILQDETYLEILPTHDVMMSQGSQCIVMTREKWLEALLFIWQSKPPAGLEVPRLPLKYPEGQE